MTADRERGVTEAFVGLATGLADGVEVIELLGSLAEDTTRLLDVASTGVLLADAHGVLHVVAASSEAMRDLEIFQLQRAEGPCLDCFHSGKPVTVADLGAETARWPQFAPAAAAAGFVSAHALPIRLRDRVLGCVGLFGSRTGMLGADDVRLAQALAYVAAVTLVQEKAAADRDLINSQLQMALDSRVLIEQAKGVLSQRGGLDMDGAFTVLRGYARDHNLRLTDVARAVANRELSPQLLLAHAAARSGARSGHRPRSGT